MNIEMEKLEVSQRVNADNLPYDVPIFYSLEKEEQSVFEAKERLNRLEKNICTGDKDAFFVDWKKVGEDLNNAICKFGRTYAEKKNR